MESTIKDSFIPCNECQGGQMHQRFITYYTWLGDELITVPDFPAWVCDVCGRRQYDPMALNRLSLLLSPTAGRPSPRKRPPARRRSGTKPQRPTTKEQ